MDISFIEDAMVRPSPIIIKIRDILLPHTQLILSSNNLSKFWTTPWIRKGMILDRVLSYDIYQTGISLYYKATSYITTGTISLPHTNNSTVNAPWESHNNTPYSYIQHEEYKWSDDLREHPTHTVYSALAGEKHQSNFIWYKIIWNKYVEEKQCFMLWKVFRNALHMRENLAHKGISVSATYILCSSAVEDIHHLFFKCSFTHFIWAKIKTRGGYGNAMRNNKIEWMNICNATRWKQQSTYELLIMVKVIVTVIWKERNSIIFNHKNRNRMQIYYEICRQIHALITMSTFPFDDDALVRWYRVCIAVFISPFPSVFFP